MATKLHTDLGTTALHGALAQVTRRLRLARWLRAASRGVLIALTVSLLAVGLDHSHLLPARLPLALLLPVLLLLGLGFGSLAAFARPVDPMTAARLAEDRLGLKERLSSALEFERAGQTPRDPEAALLFRMQQEDAAACARDLQPAAAVPIRPPWEAKALIPIAVLLLLALVLPNLPVSIPPALRAERAVVQKAGEKLERDARVIEKRADAQGLPATKQAAQNMQKLGQRMSEGRMDKKQAMVQASQLTKQMAEEQRRLAQAASQTGQREKSLTQAGRQLSQALSQSASGQNSPPHGQMPPGQAGQKNSPSSSQGQTSSPSTPEIQKAGQALQRNNTPRLSEQLRTLSQRTASGHSASAERQQAARDVQNLADALKGTPLTETQRHAQAAADALKRGDTQRAADEMKQAADAADHQSQQQADARGMQDAQQSLQRGRQQMAQAAKPGDIPDDSHSPAGQTNPGGQQARHGEQGQNGQAKQGQTGQGSPGPRGSSSSQDSGQQSGQGSGKSDGASHNGQPGSGSPQGGAPSNAGSGDGKSAPARPGPGQYSSSSGGDEKTPSQNTGIVRGAPHPLDPKFDPRKNPKYGRVFLGKGDGSGRGRTVGMTKAQPGVPAAPAPPTASSVPYDSTLAPARKSAETVMDKEDIPPAYRSSVRRYFDALQPPAARPAK